MSTCPRCGQAWAFNRDGCSVCDLTGLDILIDKTGMLQKRKGTEGMSRGNTGGLYQQSAYMVRCGNCRCEFDCRPYQACPSCGQASSQAQMQYAQSQQQQMAQQQWSNSTQAMHTLSNQMNGGVGGLLGGSAGLAAHLNQMAQAQFNPAVKDVSGVPELDEYNKRVAALKPSFQITEKKVGMFGLFVKRKEMELELKKLADNLDHHKRNEEMRIAEAVQKERLKANEAVSKVTLEAEAKVKKVEADALLKITELQGKATREKSEIQAAHATALAEAKAKAAEEYFEKMSKAMTELHQNGDKNSKFIQELALTMVKKAPRGLGNTKLNLKGSVKDLKQLESDD